MYEKKIKNFVIQIKKLKTYYEIYILYVNILLSFLFYILTKENLQKNIFLNKLDKAHLIFNAFKNDKLKRAV